MYFFLNHCDFYLKKFHLCFLDFSCFDMFSLSSKIVTILMYFSINAIICVISEWGSIDWFFSSLWAIFFHFFLCPVTFYCIPITGYFTFWGTRYFCIFTNFLELYSGMWLCYLKSVRFLWSCFSLCYMELRAASSLW